MTLIAKLQGGLGNQMFQYAAAYAATSRTVRPLKLDLTGFGLSGSRLGAARDQFRTPDILDFAITADIATNDEVAQARRPRFGPLSVRWRQLKYKYLVNYYIGFHDGLLAPDRGRFMEGYFQDERYFLGAASEIRSQFQLLHPAPAAYRFLTDSLIADDRHVSIHVRRGDYVEGRRNTTQLAICGPAYYENAVSAIRSRIRDFRPVVFSDDVAWVKKNLDLGSDAIYPAEVASLTAPQELVLMSACRHHIIANSTFSWWGAYLDPNPHKTVLAPSIWSRQGRGYKNMIPPGWICIPVA